jgi:hypothetical protein
MFGKKIDSPPNEGKDLLDDCRVMLRFALKEGLNVSEDLQKDIARLDELVKAHDLPPISALPPSVIDGSNPAAPPATLTELVLKVHEALSRVIVPATALTLQVSEPPPGKHRFLGGMPVLVKLATLFSLLFAAGFVLTSIPAVTEKAEKAAAVANATASPAPTGAPVATGAPAAPAPASVEATPPFVAGWMRWEYWLPSLNAFFGAGLGAAFYILLSTQPYLANRSFDPKYNAIYTARFITGVIAGVILAIALRPFVTGVMEKGSQFAITPGILAILGGYAAEAVQQILQRLVEIILTAVRGDGSAQAQAKAAAAQTQQAARLQKIMMDYEREPDPTKKQSLLKQIYDLLGTPLPSS